VEIEIFLDIQYLAHGCQHYVLFLSRVYYPV
jgi:hypothetical protein